MNTLHVTALETRLRWFRWGSSGVGSPYTNDVSLTAYLDTLRDGPTFVMNAPFCDLVDYARQTIPDDLVYENAWLVQPQGWMWLERPFHVPPLRPNAAMTPLEQEHVEKLRQHLRICAVGWYRADDDTPDNVLPDALQHGLPRPPGPGATQFCCFYDLNEFEPGHPGFGTWSLFGLRDGDKVLERIHQFEQYTGSRDNRIYAQDRTTDMLHDMRWVYTAMHLMSQKLATTKEHTADRATRRRLERERETTPATPQPSVRVVTLRRLEEARSSDPQGHKVDWQWQWHVRGFWREQWYATEKAHKTIWIEDFIKGPADKPLKPPVHTIYVARR